MPPQYIQDRGHYVAGIGREAGEYIFLNDPYVPNNLMSIDEYIRILSQKTLVNPFTSQEYTIMIDYICIVGG